MSKIVHIMTFCWDKPFVSWFSRFALPSIYQPGNVGALVADGWEIRHTVYSVQRDMADIIEAGAFHGARLRVECFELTQPATLRKLQSELLIHAAERALADDAFFVPASAVTIWSNGALANCVRVAETTDCAVGAMYLGVDGEKWDREFSHTFTNSAWEGDELATRAFEFLHPGSRSTLDRETSRCHLTGNGMIQLAPDLLALRCQVPSVAACRFRPSDLAFFKLENDFRCWDSSWPGTLIRDNRYTFLASSDLAFQVNLIRAGKQNQADYEAMDAAFGPMRDRRHAARATIQGEAARTFLASIRTSRAVSL